jgi:hypothetical protein
LVGFVSGVYGSRAAEYDTIPFTLAKALPTERTSGPLPAGFSGYMPRPRGNKSLLARGARGSSVFPASAVASMGPFSTDGNQRFVMQPLFV